VNPLIALFGGLRAPEIIILVTLGVLLFARKPDCCRLFAKGLKGELNSEEQSSLFVGLLILVGAIASFLVVLFYSSATSH
jgi:hypothetical protein